MTYLADTNLVSELTKAKAVPAVVRWMESNADEVVISWVSVAELRAGIKMLPPGKKRDVLHEDIEALIADYYHEDLVRLQESTAARFAELVARRRSKGAPYHFADAVIASIALDRGLRVATRNTSDFPDVPTVNPWDEKPLPATARAMKGKRSGIAPGYGSAGQ